MARWALTIVQSPAGDDEGVPLMLLLRIRMGLPGTPLFAGTLIATPDEVPAHLSGTALGNRAPAYRTVEGFAGGWRFEVVRAGSISLSAVLLDHVHRDPTARGNIDVVCCGPRAHRLGVVVAPTSYSTSA